MTVSIIDVAKKAGVSKSTVSRVLTGGAVKPATKDLIKSAMHELNYVPNVVAQGLRGKRDTKIIGIYLPYNNYKSNGMFENHGFSVFFEGIQRILVAKGYDLLFIYDDLSIEGSIPKYVDYFAQNRIDGLITMGIANDEVYLRQMADQYKSVVYTGRPIEDLNAFNMYMSYYEYNVNVYDYLHNHGHKKILSITDITKEFEIYDRKFSAYKHFCQKSHLHYSSDDIIFTYNESNLKETIKNKLQEGYTALYLEDIFVVNRVMNIIHDLDLKVLEDISIIGVEHGKNLRNIYPNLTAIEIPYDKVGTICAEQMLQAIEGINNDFKHVTILPEIIERNSVRTLV